MGRVAPPPPRDPGSGTGVRTAATGRGGGTRGSPVGVVPAPPPTHGGLTRRRKDGTRTLLNPN